MRRPYPRGLGTAVSLVIVLAASSSARADEPSVQRPAGLENSVPSAPTGDAPATVTVPPTDESEPPPPAVSPSTEPAGPPTPVPADVPAETAPATGEPAPPSDASATPSDPSSANTVAPELLEAEGDDEEPPPPVIPSSEPEETSYDTALALELARLYRPPHNPGRLAVTARLMFANIGANDQVGGRMGGLQADVGQSWNSIGYGLTASVWAGRVVLDDRTSDLNALIGVGPTLNLGRRALVGRGYVDLRLGYDFFFGAVRQRDEAGEQGNVAPHGPRLQLSLGLLSSTALVQRRWFHGFGATLGYQGLVGSFTRDMPYMSMLTVGLSYWMG